MSEVAADSNNHDHHHHHQANAVNEHEARLRRLSRNAESETLQLIGSAYPVQVFNNDIRTSVPRANVASDASRPDGGGGGGDAGGAAAAGEPRPDFLARDPRIVRHHLVVAVPDRLMQKSDGLLNCVRGEGTDGTLGGNYQRAIEFVLQSMANALHMLERMTASDGAVARANAAAPAMRVFLECVVRDTPNTLPLQLPNVEALDNVAPRPTLQQHTLLFAPENILGYRLHIWIFDYGMHPTRIFAHQVARNQHETGLIDDETEATRSLMISGRATVDRVRERLWRLRVTLYRSKHPDADQEEIDENVAQPSTDEVRAAMEDARRAPSPVHIKDVRMQWQRSATELGFSIYSYEDLARFVHGVYLTCAGQAVPHDGLFVPAHELQDQTQPPGRSNHVRSMAHWNVFNFENSVRILRDQNDMAIMDPHQAYAVNYGLDRYGERLSFPYPHLVWELPVEVLNPCRLVLYKAPWREQTTYTMLCHRYEQAIQKSQEREKRALANAHRLALSASNGMDVDGADATALVPPPHQQLQGAAKVTMSHYLAVASQDAECRQTNRFGKMRREDALTAMRRTHLINEGRQSLDSVERAGGGGSMSRTRSSLFMAAAASSAAAAAANSGAYAVDEIRVDNDSEAADPHVPYHEQLTNHQMMANTGMVFDRLFTVDTPQKDFAATRIDNTITLLRQEHAPMFDRVNRIVSQWPPKHAVPPDGHDTWTDALVERERLRCARELSDALFQETARRYVHRLSSMDRDMSDLFVGIMRRLQTEDPATFIQPAFVRMPEYTLSSQANAAVLRDLGEVHNLKTLGTFAREAMVHMVADAVRPSHFIPASRVVVGAPAVGKSKALGVAMGSLPMPDFGPVQHESKLSKMGGDRNQSHTVHVRDELSSILQNHSHENHERRRDEVEQHKSLLTMQAATFERLGKDQESGSITRARVRIERQCSEWHAGNSSNVPINAETALYDRLRWSYELGLHNWGGGHGSAHGSSADDSLHAVYNFGRLRSQEADRMMTNQAQRRVCVQALIAGASDCQVLSRFDTSVFGAMMAAGLEEIRSYLPHMSHFSRLLLRGHTHSYGETLYRIYYQCFQSPASPYFIWDTESNNIVGVHPFRLETLRAKLATTLFCQPPEALNAMTMTFFEYYPRSAWFIVMVAAHMLCGFDPSRFMPLYESAGFLPDVRARAREFLPTDKRGTVKPPLPEFILEIDRILEDMRFMSRTMFPSGAVYDVDSRSGGTNPTFVVFYGSYETFLQRLTALLQRYGRVDVPQVKSVLNIMRRMQFNAPLLRIVPRGVPVDAKSIALEQVNEEGGSTRQSNNVHHFMRSAPQEGGLRDSEHGRTAVWRSYAALTVCGSSHHHHRGGGGASNSLAAAAASALTGGARGSGQTQQGGVGSENVSAKDEGGDMVKLLVHALMLRPDHLYYLFATAWMDETTESVKTLVPLDVFEHPSVWHELQLGPRYGVRLNVRNPNYRSDGARMVLDAYDMAMINQVLPGDNRSVAQVIANNADASTRMPVITYRHSLVMDQWIAFLRDNHIYPTQGELEWVQGVRASLCASPSEIHSLPHIPHYMRPHLASGLSDYELWAVLHRDRYLVPEYIVKTMQATSPQLLSMLTSPIETVDKLRYPHAVVLSSECERYIHTIVTKRMRNRARVNANHRANVSRCARTLSEDERRMLALYRNADLNDKNLPVSELGFLLNSHDDGEADRSYNMAEIIMQTCAVKAVIKHQTVLLAAVERTHYEAHGNGNSAQAAAAERKEKSRNECINALIKHLRTAVVPRDQAEREQGLRFIEVAPPLLARVFDRVMTMLYEYYVLRIAHLKTRACKRVAVLVGDMVEQRKADGHPVDEKAMDKVIVPTVRRCFTPLEQLLLDDKRMQFFVLAPPASASSSSSLPGTVASGPGTASSGDGHESDAALADVRTTMRNMRQRVLGGNDLSYLYADDEIMISESESEVGHRHRAPLSSSSSSTTHPRKSIPTPVTVSLRRPSTTTTTTTNNNNSAKYKNAMHTNLDDDDDDLANLSGAGSGVETLANLTTSPKGSCSSATSSGSDIGGGDLTASSSRRSFASPSGVAGVKRPAISSSSSSSAVASVNNNNNNSSGADVHGVVVHTPQPTRQRIGDPNVQAAFARLRGAKPLARPTLFQSGGGPTATFATRSALTGSSGTPSSSSNVPMRKASMGTLEADDEMNM